jgi:tRNA-Thr(GGU) m(6)t(6)A37 methyltransferase TsaA
MSGEISMKPIGVVESCFGEKFGTPRQSGIVESACGRIVFSDEVDDEACRGLEEFSHLWLVFLFDQVDEEKTRWLVRPPRLGGNEKKGVFATRSPFRPNRIGLSLVKFESIGEGCLEVSGLDLVDGTPILDVKPYLPYVESVLDAKGGFAETAPVRMEVVFQFDDLKGGDRRLISEALSLDPRPAYHDDPERIYGCLLAGYEVKWRAEEGKIKVLSAARA